MHLVLSPEVSEFLDKVEEGLVETHEAVLVILALLQAANRVSEEVPVELEPTAAKRWFTNRVVTLVNVAERHAEELVGNVDDAITLVANRGQVSVAATGTAAAEKATDEELSEIDGTALVHRAVEDTAMRFWSLGVVPLLCIFSDQERKQLGDKPLERLVVLVERAIASLKPRTIEEPSDAHDTLVEAAALVRTLVQGAQMRTWDEPPELKLAEEIFGKRDADESDDTSSGAGDE